MGGIVVKFMVVSKEDSDCPVTNSETLQDFNCEICDFKSIYSLSELKELDF